MLKLTFKQALQRGYIKPIRKKSYLAWMVKNCRCPCGAAATESHHLISAGFGGGMGTKNSDLMAFPICGLCHAMLHADVAEWEDCYGSQYEHVVFTMLQAVNEGVLSL